MTEATLTQPQRRFSPGRLLTSGSLSELTIFALLVLIVVAFSLLTPPGTFLSVQNIESIALTGSQLALIGAGVTFLLIAAGIDLSVGSMVAFSSVAAAQVMSTMTANLLGEERTLWAVLGPVLLGALVAVLVGTGWGVVNGLIVTRTKIPPFVATLATSTLILGLTQIWSGGVNVTGAPVELQTAYGMGKFLGVIPYPVLTAAIVVAVLWFVLAKTRFGLRNFAIGANPESARRAGINVDRHLIVVYGMVGLLSGIAGTIDVARYTTATISGYTGTALAAITAVVIGGTSLWGGRGRMSGTIVGAFIPATLTSGFVVMGLPPFWQNVAIGVVLLLAVWADQYRRSRAARG
ncbi:MULTISPECIES: ABC transporter permease [unclassified Microbacterium]|uniref:ABC transporter permease n=1 Tax=unclassified Microbacterium TaxID=2609290 RepID=UPI0030170FA4